MNDAEDDEEKLGFNLKLKKYRMLLSYYIKKFGSRLSLAYILFVINFALFCLILMPNLVHRSHIPIGSWPMVLELHGTVLIQINIANESNLIPVPAVYIKIGGYQATTDSYGNFHITFTAQTNVDIPIIFHRLNHTYVKWVSYDQGHFEKEEVYILE